MVAFCSDGVRVSQRSSLTAEATSEARRRRYLAFFPIVECFGEPVLVVTDDALFDLPIVVVVGDHTLQLLLADYEVEGVVMSVLREVETVVLVPLVIDGGGVHYIQVELAHLEIVLKEMALMSAST
jgi:hypothetical protein